MDRDAKGLTDYEMCTYQEHVILLRVFTSVVRAAMEDPGVWDRIEEYSGIKRRDLFEKLTAQDSFDLRDAASVMAAIGKTLDIRAVTMSPVPVESPCGISAEELSRIAT